MRDLVISALIGAVVGGSGITGIIFFFIRRYIEKKLETRDEISRRQREQKIMRLKIEDELQHCEGRLFFWIHKAIVTGTHNGDLENAFNEYQAAEERKKELDRDIIFENQ